MSAQAGGVLAVFDALNGNTSSLKLDAQVREARATFKELIEALRPLVATTFEEARAADDRGESLMWCECDALNPCWHPGRAITTPLRHWGWTPDATGDGLACSHCRIRAALARAQGGQS